MQGLFSIIVGHVPGLHPKVYVYGTTTTAATTNNLHITIEQAEFSESKLNSRIISISSNNSHTVRIQNCIWNSIIIIMRLQNIGLWFETGIIISTQNLQSICTVYLRHWSISIIICWALKIIMW